MIEKFVQHRGLNAKNSVPNSFESLPKNYQKRVECDVVMLQDGNLAIMHEKDFNLSLNNIEGMNLAAIEKLRIPTTGDDIHQPNIPLFKEFISLAYDTDTKLAIEIRASDLEKSKALAKKIIDELISLQKTGVIDYETFLTSKISLQSFSTEILKNANEYSSENHQKINTTLYWPSDEPWSKKIPLFNQADLRSEDIEKLDWESKGLAIALKYKIPEIELQPQNITEQIIKQAHDKNLKIGSAFTNNDEEIKRILNFGIDYIITDQ